MRDRPGLLKPIFVGTILFTVLMIGASDSLAPGGTKATAGGVTMELLPEMPLAAPDVGANYTLRVSTPNGAGMVIELGSSSPAGLTAILSPSQLSTDGGAHLITVELTAGPSLLPGLYPINITSTSAAGQSSQTFVVKVVKYLVVTEVLRPSFEPGNLTVPLGSTVYWIRLNGAFGFYDNGYHQVVFNTLGVQSPDFLSQYQPWSYTFDKTGTFRYHCDFHAFMTGSVNVVSTPQS